MGTSPPISYFSQMHQSLSLSLSHIHTSGQGIKKKECGFWEKQKVLFLQQEDYHYGYWGISYKEWTTLTYPLSFLLVCREYVLRSKQVNKGHWSGKENGTTFVRSPGKINCGIWGCMIFKFQFHLH